MKRKANNTRARLDRSCRALLASNHVAIINMEPGLDQFLINLRTGRPVWCDDAMLYAIYDVAHHWTITFAFVCQDQNGLQYLKSSEIATPSLHMAAQLPGVIEQHYLELRDSCNPVHIKGSCWIANTHRVSLEQADIDRLFQAAQITLMKTYQARQPAMAG